MIFKIAIEEAVVEEFEIEAEDACSAMEIAEEKYRKKEIALEPRKCQFKQMAIIGPDYETTEWTEF